MGADKEATISNESIAITKPLSCKEYLSKALAHPKLSFSQVDLFSSVNISHKEKHLNDLISGNTVAALKFEMPQKIKVFSPLLSQLQLTGDTKSALCL